jgi:anti-sigma factor RsiW
MTHQEYEELLSAYIDFETTPEEERVITEHLRYCPTCGRLYEQNKILKEKLRGLNDSVPIPRDLNRLLATSAGNVKKERYVPRLSFGFAFSIFIVAIVAVFAAVILFKPAGQNPLINAVFDSYVNIYDGKLPLVYRSQNPADLKIALDKSGGIPFEFDVDDFDEMGFDLKGALVKDLANRKSLIFIYQGKEPVGYYLLSGLKSDFPVKANKVVQKNGTGFYIVERDGYNLIMWEEEGKTCFMVSKLDPDVLVTLASESVED